MLRVVCQKFVVLPVEPLGAMFACSRSRARSQDGPHFATSHSQSRFPGAAQHMMATAMRIAYSSLAPQPTCTECLCSAHTHRFWQSVGDQPAAAMTVLTASSSAESCWSGLTD
jgi:hypothetical protein